MKPQIDAAVARVIDSAQFVLGPEVSAFEDRFAAYCGVKHCTALNSGTSALHLALLSAGIGPGDEVITVSMTFVATTAAILYCGAKPVFVDVDPDTWTMDPKLIETAITPRTKAILPVHLHGLMADMDPIMELARRHKLIQRPPCRFDRRYWMLQLLSWQEPWRLRRRWGGCKQQS
jgi:dTDP-4-amino-4,6-dideoxygalactose transaminase